MKRTSLVLAGTVFLLMAGAAGAADTPSFADIAPILNKSCLMCHSGEKPPLDLRLDTYENVMKGSRNGPVIHPKDPQRSELVRRIRGESKPRMPMTGPPWLSEEETAKIEAWIAAGAPGDLKLEAEPQGAKRRPGDASGALTYTDVAPIFNARCVKCHAERGLMGAPPEGIRLDSYENILRASERAVIVPGSPGASLLDRAIRGVSRPRMPFDGPPWLDQEEIDLISRWIEGGARGPDGRKAPVPAGARIRLEGRLTGRWDVDGLPLLTGSRTRIDKNPRPGDRVEVRGRVEQDGRIFAERIRRR